VVPVCYDKPRRGSFPFASMTHVFPFTCHRYDAFMTGAVFAALEALYAAQAERQPGAAGQASDCLGSDLPVV
jgi:hypothetical protein